MSMTTRNALAKIAEAYVNLVLAVGEHDPSYVDAYYGSPEQQQKVKDNVPSLSSILAKSRELIETLGNTSVPADEERRKKYLQKQLQALEAHTRQLQGERFSFDEEARLLYDAVPPKFTEERFISLLQELDTLFPGTATISERVESYRRNFIIPIDKLEKVFHIALEECRTRTQKYIPLPSYERFHLEFVREKSWSGYNWYKGNGESIIQINIDLPIFAERIVDLAAHEGYPGHHVYNILLEQECLRKRRWIEFSIYALYSPQSFIAEGAANYGIDVAFPDNERMVYERDVLFPICGFDPLEAGRYSELQRISTHLNYAHNEAARNYLDGLWTTSQTQEWLVTYALMSPERALQRIHFFEQYRSYVINYNFGLDLVRRYCESQIGDKKNSSKRWEVFRTLLSIPFVPSELVL